MPAETPNVTASTPSISTVPRAVWIGGGLLAVVTAGLAGALITRAVQPESPAAIAQPATLALAATVAPAAAVASAAAQPVPPTTRTAAKPAHAVVKPVPSTRAPAPTERAIPAVATQAVICAACGTVESVSAVQQKGQGTGLGAVAGGVLGGVLGHQVGGGNGKTAMTVLGAVGGGLAGNEVEKHARSETLFDVRVRMDDGSVRTFQRAQAMAVGTNVVVEGTSLRAARDAGSNTAPATVRTSAPAGGGA